MKKTITVNVGGFSFVIDETAYQSLQTYLANIEAKLADDASEIMQDIEWRVAELFKERLAIKEVVDESDVRYVQTIIGSPEDFEDETAGEPDNESFQQEQTQSTDKALYRDMDNAVLGGVCSGLAKYFNIDPLVMRVIFIFFAVFLGSGLLLYIILLILIPSAKTTAEKLRMSGEAVNLESIKGHFNKLGTDLNDKIKSKQFNKKVNSATEKTVTAFTRVANIIGKIVGVALTVFGIVWLLSVILYLTGSGAVIPFTSIIIADSLSDFLLIIMPSATVVNITLVSLIFVLFIPLISIIYLGLRLLFNIKTRLPKAVSISGTVLFAVALCFLVISLLRTAVSFGQDVVTVKKIEFSAADTLQIDVLPVDSDIFQSNSAYGCCSYMVVQKDSIVMKNIELFIKEVDDSSAFTVTTEFKSNGITDGQANELANKIQYNLKLDGAVLSLPQSSTIARADKFRAQHIRIIIELPTGKAIKFTSDSAVSNRYISDNGLYQTQDYKGVKYFIWRSFKEQNGYHYSVKYSNYDDYEDWD